MDIMKRFEEKCAHNPKRIVFPESRDERILRAASILSQRDLVRPVLVGREEQVLAQAERLGVGLEGIEIADPSAPERNQRYLDEYLSVRASRHLNRAVASRVLRKDLFYGAMMVRMGDADGMVAGAANLTASVIKAGKLIIGLRDGVSEPSSFFIMLIPGFDPMVFADCAVNASPEPELLAQIAISSAVSARELLSVEPRVAMLSFSTKGSATHPDVKKVVEATRLARERAPDLRIDGEVQADAAIVPEIAEKKGASPILAGRSNVLIFPDLDAGNIAYKLVEHLAHARAFGPFMQGFRRPINDLSRGCSVEEVVGTTLVTSIQAGGMT